MPRDSRRVADDSHAHPGRRFERARALPATTRRRQRDWNERLRDSPNSPIEVHRAGFADRRRTSKRVGVWWCSGTGEIFADRVKSPADRGFAPTADRPTPGRLFSTRQSLGAPSRGPASRAGVMAPPEALEVLDAVGVVPDHVEYADAHTVVRAAPSPWSHPNASRSSIASPLAFLPFGFPAWI